MSSSGFLQDYIRAGCASALSSSLVASGSYDHTVRLWDQRKGSGAEQQVLCVDHGSPVEAVAFMPNESLLVSAGTNGSYFSKKETSIIRCLSPLVQAGMKSVFGTLSPAAVASSAPPLTTRP